MSKQETFNHALALADETASDVPEIRHATEGELAVLREAAAGNEQLLAVINQIGDNMTHLLVQIAKQDAALRVAKGTLDDTLDQRDRLIDEQTELIMAIHDLGPEVAGVIWQRVVDLAQAKKDGAA